MVFVANDFDTVALAVEDVPRGEFVVHGLGIDVDDAADGRLRIFYVADDNGNVLHFFADRFQRGVLHGDAIDIRVEVRFTSDEGAVYPYHVGTEAKLDGGTEESFALGEGEEGVVGCVQFVGGELAFAVAFTQLAEVHDGALADVGYVESVVVGLLGELVFGQRTRDAEFFGLIIWHNFTVL